MTISDETGKRVAEFAQEQSRHYLDRTQMTYWEKAQAKVDKTKRKAEAKAAKFKMRSAQAQDAQDDLAGYMTDFIEDLVAQGMAEEEAYARACTEFAHDSKTSAADDLYEHYAEKYYDQFSDQFSENYNPVGFMGGWGTEAGNGFMGSAAGLYYSGCSIVGIILGALIGTVLGFVFFPGLCGVGSIVGFLAGAVGGVGVAMLLHAHALNKPR